MRVVLARQVVEFGRSDAHSGTIFAERRSMVYELLVERGLDKLISGRRELRK